MVKIEDIYKSIAIVNSLWVKRVHFKYLRLDESIWFFMMYLIMTRKKMELFLPKLSQYTDFKIQHNFL